MHLCKCSTLGPASSSLHVHNIQLQVPHEFVLDFCPWHAKILLHLVSVCQLFDSISHLCYGITYAFAQYYSPFGCYIEYNISPVALCLQFL